MAVAVLLSGDAMGVGWIDGNATLGEGAYTWRHVRFALLGFRELWRKKHQGFAN